MVQEWVPFPHDSPNWALVQRLLGDLQESLVNERVTADDTVVHLQVVYVAINSPFRLDQQWLQCQPRPSSQAALMQGARHKVDQTHVGFGLLQWLKRASREEREKFLYATLPNIIELALRIEEHTPQTRPCYSQQQKGGATSMSRQLVSSILSCAFLCLFPERGTSRPYRLNHINFTQFFKQLPLLSQVGKLQCILHYFERAVAGGLERPGAICFFRQVASKTVLPSVCDLTRSDVALCTVVVCSHGTVEDVASSALQVQCGHCSIGGDVLDAGNAQEEIRFSVCPELIASCVFMENLEDNEAAIITGFEQFSAYTGYKTSFRFEGPYCDKAEKDLAGNLCSMLCVIDTPIYRQVGREKQYQESCMQRDLHKTLIGFSRIHRQAAATVTSSDVTASVLRMADVMARCLLSQGLVEAVRSGLGLLSQYGEDVSAQKISSDTTLADKSTGSPHSGSSSGQSPRGGRPGLGRYGSIGSSSSGGGSNGERLSLPLVGPRGHNGSCDMLEVDYGEWLANFRRRSSQLSDLNSRRSSSSTKHSSDFSSDLDEIYETLAQTEKAEHGVIAEEEHLYGAALSEYAADFVSMLVAEGTFTAAHMLPGIKEFQHGRPPVVCPSSSVRNSREKRSSVAGDKIVQSSQPLEDRTVREELVPSPALVALVDSLVVAALRCGVAEAASAVLEFREDEKEEVIPDDVYRWFADKIVQEVFSHVVDELYFQRFTSDSHWQADMAVNREGVLRLDLTDSESVSSTTSNGELSKVFLDAAVGATMVSAAEVTACLPVCLDGESHSILPAGERQGSAERRLSDTQSAQKQIPAGIAETTGHKKHGATCMPLSKDSPASERFLQASIPQRGVTRLSLRQTSMEMPRSKHVHTIARQRSLDVPSSGQSFESDSLVHPLLRHRVSEVPFKSSKERGSSKLKGLTNLGDVLPKRKTPESKDMEGEISKSKSCVPRLLSAEAASRLDQGNFKKSTLGRRSASLIPDYESTELKDRREERKSVKFTVGESKHFGRGESAKTSAVPTKTHSSIPRMRHLYVVKDVPMPIAKDFTGDTSKTLIKKEKVRAKVISTRPPREVVTSKVKEPVSLKSGKKELASKESAVLSGRSLGPRKSSSSSSTSSLPSQSFTVTACSSSIPLLASLLSSSSSSPPSRTVHHSSCVSVRTLSAQTTPAFCDTAFLAGESGRNTDPVSVSSMVSATAFPSLELEPSVKGSDKQSTPESHFQQQTLDVQTVKSPSHLMQVASVRENRRQSLPSRFTSSRSTALSRQFSEPGGACNKRRDSEPGAVLRLSSADLSLDYYRVAAAIVNQVFQSLPQHLNPEELQQLQNGNRSSFYYQGRKYESIVPRDSNETAADIIGACEKGNVVSETFIQSKGKGIGSRTSSPRRIRTHSPSVSWLTKRLSRETLTNAFVRVGSHHSLKSYERRSSEPCQRSITLSLQNSLFGCNGMGKGRGGITDDEFLKGKAESCWRRGSLDSMELSRRRSSCGFLDPVLSRFAQELILADTSVPQLVLMDSGSTSSTTGSRRSSMSGFRDTTLATFESELLNSSFTFSQTTGHSSPRHHLPNRSHSHESHTWRSDSSEADVHWFPLPRRVGYECQDSLEALQRSFSAEDVYQYAEFIANNIIQQAVGILSGDCKTPPTQQDLDIDIFSENLADQILREGLVASAQLLGSESAVHVSGTLLSAPDMEHWRDSGFSQAGRSGANSSLSSGGLSGRSLQDRMEDFHDMPDRMEDFHNMLDPSGDGLECYASGLARVVLGLALEDLAATLRQLEPCMRTIAAGSRDCEEFGVDPCLQMMLQWLAASLLHCPRLLYFTYGDARLKKMEQVVELIQRQGWKVGQLMTAVKVYCDLVLSQKSSSDLAARSLQAAATCSRDPVLGASLVERGAERRSEVEDFFPSINLFDFLLAQSQSL